jgi:ketosteroid isomerase-like protein
LANTRAAPQEASAETGTGTGSEFVDRFESAWATSNPDRLAELLADDVVLIQPTMPVARGKAAAREGFARLLRMVPDLHVVVHGWAERDDTVFIEFTLTGTFGGKEVAWPAVDRITLRDGLIAERVSYFDSVPVNAQMLTRPRGWGRLLRSGFRPSLRSSPKPHGRRP